MSFKKVKKTGVVINTDSFDEYKKNRKTIIKTRTAKQNELEKELKSVKNEISEIKQMLKELLCQK